MAAGDRDGQPRRDSHRDADEQQQIQPRQEAWRSEHAHMDADLGRTVMLLETVARVEKNVAQTLRVMATLDGGEFAARRLRLADEAIQGARAAIERSERLQVQARRWQAHVDVVRLHHALQRAGELLTGLARAEKDIADILTSLAREDGSDLAAQREELAQQAREGAARASDRAQALRELAATTAAAGQHGNSPDGQHRQPHGQQQ